MYLLTLYCGQALNHVILQTTTCGGDNERKAEELVFILRCSI
jgi:hypothetical protein